MKKGEYIEKIYLKGKEFNLLIEQLKKYSFEDYLKPDHYEMSLLSKGTDENELRKIYSKFHLIKLIMLRKRDSGYNNYDFHYELEKGNYAVFVIHFSNNEKENPKMDNAFITNTIFKNFLKSVIKRYAKKMI